MKERLFTLADEAATVALGRALAQQSQRGFVLHLFGDLGPENHLQPRLSSGAGASRPCEKPDLHLVEPYELSPRPVYHFDLYRPADPEELEFMGIRDYFGENTVCLVEWPQKGPVFCRMQIWNCTYGMMVKDGKPVLPPVPLMVKNSG